MQARDACQRTLLDGDKGAARAVAAHELISQYLLEIACPDGKSFQPLPETRAISPLVLKRLPLHLTRADNKETLVAVLTSLAFLKAKTDAGLVVELVEDLHMAQQLRHTKAAGKKLRDCMAFISEKSHVLRVRPFLFLQEARNQHSGSFVLESLREMESSPIEWFCWTNKPQHRPICLRTLLVREPSSVTLTESGSTAVVTDGCLLRAFNSSTGEETAVLVGHGNATHYVLCHPIKENLVVSLATGELFLWDLLQQSAALHHIELQGFPVSAAWALSGKQLCIVSQKSVDVLSDDLIPLTNLKLDESAAG